MTHRLHGHPTPDDTGHGHLAHLALLPTLNFIFILFQAAGFPCIICAHIADGNFHAIIPYQPEAYAKVKDIESRMIRRALR